MDWIEVKEVGNKEKERIVFRPNSKIDLGYYILFIVKRYSQNKFSSTPEHVLWLPQVEVDDNDIVVVYTKSGERKTKKNTSGTTTHFFYWGLPSTQFEGDYMPVLIEAKGWIGVQNADDEISQ